MSGPPAPAMSLPPSRPQASPEGGERLQKLMARAGVASRRAAEELIAAGRVSVNGHVVTEPGLRADPSRDRITVDGQPLKLPAGPAIVLLLHKPTGVVTTRKDPEGRTTIAHFLPDKWQHLHPIGRLDYDTSGALLLTDDGSLTQLLTHPSHGVEKVYWARVKGHVTVPALKQLEAGIYLEDGKTAPCRARVRAQTERNALVQITLHEGRNRQVRRMLEAVGHPVRALRRVRVAGLGLEDLASGAHRQLLPGEVHALRKAAEGKAHRAGSGRRQAADRGRTTAGAPRSSRATSHPPRAAQRAAQGAPQKLVERTPQRAAQQPAQRPAQHPVARRIEQKFAQQTERQWGQKTRPSSTRRAP